MRIIAQLQAEKDKLLLSNSGLQKEVTLLSSNHENMTKIIRMLNSGSHKLDEILQLGKNARNVQGIGFNYKHLNKQGKTHVTKFVPSKTKYDSTMLDNMSRHSEKYNKKKLKIMPHSLFENVTTVIKMVI